MKPSEWRWDIVCYQTRVAHIVVRVAPKLTLEFCMTCLAIMRTETHPPCYGQRHNMESNEEGTGSIIKADLSLSREDAKRLHGGTLIPWSRGKLMAWDETAPDTYVQSHLDRTSLQTGAAAEHAVNRQQVNIQGHYQYTHHHTSSDRDERSIEWRSHRTDPEHRTKNHLRNHENGLYIPTHLYRNSERKCVGLPEHIPSYRI